MCSIVQHNTSLRIFTAQTLGTHPTPLRIVLSVGLIAIMNTLLLVMLLLLLLLLLRILSRLVLSCLKKTFIGGSMALHWSTDSKLKCKLHFQKVRSQRKLRATKAVAPVPLANLKVSMHLDQSNCGARSDVSDVYIWADTYSVKQSIDEACEAYRGHFAAKGSNIMRLQRVQPTASSFMSKDLSSDTCMPEVRPSITFASIFAYPPCWIGP